MSAVVLGINIKYGDNLHFIINNLQSESSDYKFYTKLLWLVSKKNKNGKKTIKMAVTCLRYPSVDGCRHWQGNLDGRISGDSSLRNVHNFKRGKLRVDFVVGFNKWNSRYKNQIHSQSRSKVSAPIHFCNQHKKIKEENQQGPIPHFTSEDEPFLNHIREELELPIWR